MEKKKKRKFKILVSILIIIILLVCTSAYLVFWDGTPDIAENQSINLVEELRAKQVSGGTLEVTEGDLNSTFKNLFDKPVSKGGVTINGAYVRIGNNKLTLFAQIKYKNMSIVPNITGSIDYENDRLVFKISSVKLGKLSIPKSVLINRLKVYSSIDINIDENRIEISKFLLPFNTNDIYLSDGKIIAQIAKSPLLQVNAAAGNNSNNQNITVKKGEQNSVYKAEAGYQKVNTSSGNNQSNKDSMANAQTPSTVKLPPAQLASLNRVSGQLNNVISDVHTDTEKQMMKKIQNVVRAVSADPNYAYQGQANEVKAWYISLKPEEKVRVKDAILNNVNVIEILKLVNIFGV